MSTRPALVVPVALDALVVSPAVLRRDGFRSWRRNYLALNDYMSPEPDEGDRQTDDPLFSHTGVHLHWTLPRGLRHGVEDPATGEVDYPLVPNRWLVTRFSGTGTRRVRAWVVESDCPHTPYARQQGHPLEHSSPYLVTGDTLGAWSASPDPYRNARTSKAHQAAIGLAFPHGDDTPWTERAPRDPLFLTAMDAGDPHFTTYVPHNTNVFSFLDDLSDVPGPDTLGYQVVGWYSDPAADVLAALPPGSSYADQLDRLGWRDPRLTGNPVLDADLAPTVRSLYQGLALSVPWDPAATGAPSPDPLHTVRDSGALNVAIGTTTEDAFTALAGHALQATGARPTATDLQLLRAFLHDLLPVADEKGGDERVRRAVHAASFGASAGGYRWTVTPPPADPAAEGTAGGRPPEPFTPPGWLTTLNDDQHRLDGLLGEVHALQWRLNSLWLKNGLLGILDPPPAHAPDQDDIQAELDPTREGSLAHTVRARTAAARALTGLVPQPDRSAPHTGAHDALLAGISAFGRARGLPDGAVLKAVPRPSYWHGVNPVVSVSGILPPADTTVTDTPVPVRPLTDDTPTPLVGAVTVDGRTVTASPGQGPMPALPGPGSLPGEIAGLLTEYFLLDPGNATALAAVCGLPEADVLAVLAAHRPGDFTGTLPALGTAPWVQPWEPLFMEWKTVYHHIPHTTGGQSCWAFDGTDYRYVPGTAPTPKPVVVKGVSELGPHPRALFAARLKEFVSRHGSADQRDRLPAWLSAVGDWGILAQELTGFNDRLAARDTRAFRRPTAQDRHFPEVAGLAGYPDAAGDDALPERYRGRVTSVPYLPGGESGTFHETRQGQIHLEELFLYDKFGRVLDVVSSDLATGGLHDYRNFPLIVDTALTTESSLAPTVAAVAQLPPRPLQPARLDFDLLDAATGTRVVETAADPDPVTGWLLPDHLDRSLLLYGPTGRFLGTYRLLTNATGTRTGQWEPPPDGTVTSLAQVEALAPTVAGLLRSRALSDEANLSAFLDVIDSTLWTTDPLGDRTDQTLSVLVGRPLALVRARLRLSLDGPPRSDTGWAATLRPPPSAFTADTFAVRLGDQAARDDGLIGYYRTASGGGYDYERFDSVTAPDADQNLVVRIGPPGAPDPARPPNARTSNAPTSNAPTPNYVALTFGDAEPTGLLLLMDPRASVHAVSGITPAVSVTVPQQHVDGALRRLGAVFRFGPVLGGGGEGGALTFPQPSTRHGTWSWLRPPPPPGGSWTPYDLAPAPPNAAFPDRPPVLEDGLLRLLTEPEAEAEPAPEPEPEPEPGTEQQ
ncbi:MULTISPECIES: hypothetical protein [Streptomyces]|uniref:hypothetical protein n=1 Tax=Streptomyces TaxID=1883 RepID=UPI00025CC68A|nr:MULTISPECIES: hypothetical protein [Streptomyces]AZK97628.1 hypothetical protein B7R87_29880 [Streptomyces tsukubensis]EIF93804.1 hypothetical protein [Streptomyces tsukubensis NRRL18488]